MNGNGGKKCHRFAVCPCPELEDLILICRKGKGEEEEGTELFLLTGESVFASVCVYILT